MTDGDGTVGSVIDSDAMDGEVVSGDGLQDGGVVVDADHDLLGIDTVPSDLESGTIDDAGVVDGEGTELASGGDLTADISGDVLDHQ